jgi:putative membrane protein
VKNLTEKGGNTALEDLSRYIFAAPEWPRSVAIMILLGIVIDGAGFMGGRNYLLIFGFFGYVIPALFAFVFTKPCVELVGGKITWNRSALLAMACMVFQVIVSFLLLFLPYPNLYPVVFAVALGVVFATRLIVLVAIADYRMSRMVPAAALQSIAAAIAGTFYFGMDFLYFVLALHLLFGCGVLLFIWLVERPLKKNFRISALHFINAFIAHNTDGDKALDEFFMEIGEDVYVQQASVFFRREGRGDITFTVPNLHPGPMGEIGGANLPKVLHDMLGPDTFVAHGCATHDFNLVSESDVTLMADAVKASRRDAVFSEGATASRRYTCGTVDICAQGFGDTLLLVATRSPEMTEDLEYAIGLAVMAECQGRYAHVAFVDAHNCMVDVTEPIVAGSLTAYEYWKAAEEASVECAKVPLSSFEAGSGHRAVPFSREDGFGDLGIMALVIRVEGQVTAYVLFDGNNVEHGVREVLRDHLLTVVDECEIMTTDSHVVNMLSGRNPVGFRVTAEEIIPYAEDAVRAAVADLAPAEAAGGTGWVEGVTVFGSNRISQLASTVNAMLTFVAPLGLAILLFAFLLSIVAYLVLL